MRRSAILAAKVVLSIAVLGYVLATVPLASLGEALSSASPGWVAVAFGIKAIAIVASVLLWRAVQDPAVRPPFRMDLRTYAASVHAGLAGPGNLGGDAYRVAAAGGLRRADHSIAGILGERGLSAAALLGGAAAGAWLVPGAEAWRFPLAAMAAIALGGVLVAAFTGDRLATYVRGERTTSRMLRACLASFPRLRQRGAGRLALAGALLLPALTAASTMALFLAVNAPVSPALALFGACAAAIVVLLPLSIQGVGVREGAFLTIFTGIGGVPAHEAMAASLLSLAAGVALGIAAGLALWLPPARPQRLIPVRRVPREPLLRAPPGMLLALPLGVSLGSLGDALEKLGAVLRSLMGGVQEELRFLPPGTAPLVMIFGGLFVLAVAMAVSLLPSAGPAGQPSPAAARRARRKLVLSPGMALGTSPLAPLPPLPPNLMVPAPGAGRSYEDGFAVGKALTPADIDMMLDAAERLGLGESHLVVVEPHRFVIRFTGCQSCRIRQSAGLAHPACDFERGFLQAAARSFLGACTVEEAGCGAAGPGACEFTVRGGS